MKANRSYWFHIVIVFAIFVTYCDSIAILRTYHQSQQQLRSEVCIVSQEQAADSGLASGTLPFDFSNIDKNILADWRSSQKGVVPIFKSAISAKTCSNNPTEGTLFGVGHRYMPLVYACGNTFYNRKCPIRI